MSYPDAANAVAQPLLWLGLGGRGARMVAEVQANVERIDPADAARVRCLSLPATATEASLALRAALPDLLDRLFSAPRGAWSGLDVVLLGDLGECATTAPTDVLRAVLECLETTRGGLVRTRGVASERGLHCHAMFAMPAPSDPSLGAHALSALDSLERWHREGGHESPLARVWCWPTRGPLGSLTADDLAGILAEFAQGAFLAGARTSDSIRNLLGAADSDEGRLAVVSVSALSLPVRRVEQYLERRLALLALEAIQASVGKGSASTDPGALLREAGIERLSASPTSELPLFKKSPEADADEALAAVDAWISRRIGVEMGLERALEVEAALGSARASALEHAATCARQAGALDATEPSAASTPVTVPERTPRGLVAPVAAAAFSAVAALGCAISTPDPFPAYVWVHMAFPGLVAALIAGGSWLSVVKANELGVRNKLESDERSARRVKEGAERRSESIADAARFAHALARGLKGRADACRSAVRALDACVGRVRLQLAALDVAPGKTPDEDRVDRLLPARSSRISLLCSAADITRLARVPDLSDWMHRMLAASLPHARAERTQLEEAFADDARLVALAAEQAVLQRLREQSPFDWVRGVAASTNVGRWLQLETERMLPSHDVTAAPSGRRSLPRHRLVIGPPAAQQGEAAAFNDARRSGWIYVEATHTYSTLLVVDATTGVCAAHLRPS